MSNLSVGFAVRVETCERRDCAVLGSEAIST
jgi:hypothetical protein